MDSVVESLDRLWAAGELRTLEADLDRFIREHVPEIRHAAQRERGGGLGLARLRRVRGEITDRQFLDFCVRAVLRRRGSCNPVRDIHEQRSAIEREVWYEGERRHAPVARERREQIARAWAVRHAPQWREWHLLQMLYVWQKKADEYLELLTEATVQR